MENTSRRLVSFLLCATVIAVSSAAYYGAKNSRLESQMALSAQASSAQLVSSFSAIDTALQKARFTADPTMQAELSAEIWHESASIQACLNSLPFATSGAQEAQKFAAQAGEYARSLISNPAKNSYEMLTELEKSASFFTQNSMLGDKQSSFTQTAFKGNSSEYPALIYDGPYSEHLDKREPEFLKGKADITEQEARVIASGFTDILPQSFTVTQNFGAKMPFYRLESEFYSIDVARAGGVVINMTCGRTIGATSLTQDDAVLRAETFLRSHTDIPMKRSYSETANGCTTINFAALSGETTLYPDLIKIIVALDNGEIIGVEARGFIMSHKERTLSAPKISQADAQAKVSTNLKVLSSSLAVIPTRGENEKLCYEFICETPQSTHCIVYINAETGREQNILMLLESESGVLAS